MHTLLLAQKESMQDTEFLSELRQKGFNILIATSGEEAFQFCQEHSEIELILVGIDLPGRNGIETIRYIRQTNETVPVILLSQYVTLDSLRLANGIGCNEILQTPLNRGALDAIVTKYIHS